jgi:hypothetical protein
VKIIVFLGWGSRLGKRRGAWKAAGAVERMRAPRKAQAAQVAGDVLPRVIRTGRQQPSALLGRQFGENIISDRSACAISQHGT